MKKETSSVLHMQKRWLVPTALTASFIVFSMYLPHAAFATTTVGDLLNPDYLFRALRSNITIPISTTTQVELPTPQQAIEQNAPQLREINRDIQEETGINFAKFVGWFAKILRVFFLFIVDLLETVSHSLETPM